MKIEALCSSAPLKALERYDTWLATTRIEDVFLIAPIARGILRGIASGQDRTLRWEAERRLALDGDRLPPRACRKGPAAGHQNADDDLPLAMAGDAAAARRLLQQPSTAAQARPQALAKALPAAGPAAIPALRALLKNPAAPVRMEAALSLAKLGAVDAMADLEPLLNDPETRSFAAVALTRLGDANAEAVVREMLQSPVPDVRLLGAQAYEGKGSGPWLRP